MRRSTLVRTLYLAAGIMALILGLLGVVLPILPTTPFVLLAAACFARSSERFYNALLNHHLAGPIIADWRQHRAMRRTTKRWAFLTMALSFGTSLLMVQTTWQRVLLLVLAVVLACFIWRVPVRQAVPAADPSAADDAAP